MKAFLLTTLFLVISLTSALAQCASNESEIIVIINPDNYPAEISWELLDQTQNVLSSGTTSGDTLCIDGSECVTFNIYDSYGDGICCSYGQGSYEVLVDGVQVATGGDYDYEEAVTINCPPGFSCDNAEVIDLGSHVASDGDHWFTYTPTINGSYAITTCGQGNTCDTKMWIYEYCNMTSFEEDNTATIYYDENQGGCGEQAQLNVVLLEANVQYWVRIGDDGDDCDGTDINWSLSYNGPIAGCTDLTACNYNPIAETDDGSCIAVGDPACPDGPDLVVLSSVISSSMYLSTINAGDGNCYIPEGCLNGYGTRDILRFTTHIKNVGSLDYYIGSPSANPDQFDLVNCHNHAHYEGYAEYLLFDLNGNEIPIGFKNGFCVLDLECSDGGTAQYGCSNMGISAQCGDIYSSGLSCQWIDITDTPDGTYTMVVRTNWDQSPDALGRHETDYDNNQAQVCVILDRSSGSLVVTEDTNCAPLIDCAGNVNGGAKLDCTGVCNGTALSGDANGDYVRNMSDATEYLDLIADDDIAALPCVDLDADGEITVCDAAAMAHCLISEATHVHPPGQIDVIQECEFPVNMIHNPFDIVEFTISDIDVQGGYFDVSVKNPLTRILAYELEFEGVNISSATNLIADGSYPVAPVTGSSSRVVSLSTDDESVTKFTDFTPLVRVYFTGTPVSICLTDVVDVVTDGYELATGAIVDPCGTCPEDITGNGVVNIDDFLALNSAFGTACADCAEDLTGDGLVNIDDFLALNSAYAQSCYNLYGVIVDEELDLLADIQSIPNLIVHPELTKVIQAMTDERKLLIYPNPNRGDGIQFSISGLDRDNWGTVQIKVMDLSGKTVHAEIQNLTESASGKIVLSGLLPSGSYMVEANLEGMIFIEKLTVLR